MNHEKKMTHDEIEERVIELCDQGEKDPRVEAFGESMEAAGVFCRTYAGGHEKIYAAAYLLFREISHHSKPRDLLTLTVAELVSLFVDVNPGYMDFGKLEGLVPLNDANKRDNEY